MIVEAVPPQSLTFTFEITMAADGASTRRPVNQQRGTATSLAWYAVPGQKTSQSRHQAPAEWPGGGEAYPHLGTTEAADPQAPPRAPTASASIRPPTAGANSAGGPRRSIGLARPHRGTVRSLECAPDHSRSGGGNRSSGRPPNGIGVKTSLGARQARRR